MNDEVFLNRFEACEFTTDEWHHREHVKIAYLYLLQRPFGEALERMRAGLKALNEKQNVPEALDRGYHETITRAWMQLVHCALCESGPAENADAFLDKHTHLLARRALLFFYSRDRIMSWEAKSDFIPPNLAPLPKSARAFSPGAQTSA